MESTLRKYRQAIQSGQINPVVHWDGKTSGWIFEPTREDVPLDVMGFAAYRLDDGPFTLSTGENEFAIVPVNAKFEITVGSMTFRGDRSEGPFAALPGPSNACAVYIPRDATFTMAGVGEVVLFSAPAKGDKPPAYVPPGSRPNLRRGTGVWRRDVITVFTPEDVTTHLIGGETYSPPGLWSGTPLHVHDKDDLAAGQSDHEEVYYHIARVTDGEWGPYGVQMLFDNQGLDKAYVIHHRSAVAIPGGAHPVIAGPCSDMLYVWALAGASERLAMLDVPEFAYLKAVGEIIDEFEARRPAAKISAEEFRAACRVRALDETQMLICRLHLEQRGFQIE